METLSLPHVERSPSPDTSVAVDDCSRGLNISWAVQTYFLDSPTPWGSIFVSYGVVNRMVVVQSLGPLAPFVLTRQKMTYPLGSAVSGTYVEETVVAFTSKVVKVELVETWIW